MAARRNLLAALPLALAAPALWAQSRALRLVVPFGAGGIADLVARILAERTAAELGQPIIIENRTGAGGNIAGEFVARAAPDGQTLLFASTGILAVNAAIYPSLPFDPARDFVPVARCAFTPHLLVCQPRLASDLAGFLRACRAREESWGTAGSGTSPHQTLLLLQSLAGIRMLAVHFRSGAASVQAVLSGDIGATAEATPVVSEHIRAGTLSGLCVAAPERIALLPAVPTAAEAGLPGLENGANAGVVAPRGTPPEVVARLTRAFLTALAAPDTRERLLRQGTLPDPGDADAFTALITAERARWRPLLAGVRAE